MSTARGAAAVALLGGLAVLSGCGDRATGDPVPTVAVEVGPQQVTLDPTQWCRDGEGERYQVTAPILEVSPDTPVTLEVPDEVADDGWSVQVFDEQLEEQIGEVDVDAGQAVFDGISTSDVVPPTYYLVVVQRADPDACEGLSGAWPVGFIRAGEGATTTTEAPPAG
ncbi:DUF2771 family protein [Modestobacter roseus]|uniref:Uncharacterized protein DUF2771 n=1 Tax=Modestobacter roseus TaxID=1181884 RepID=A0A562IXJ1_9ACTN|nr:DUF2771 family protein [Modestobacter roseus]TWH75677.1 uncharacterized protein DUF2771 [Modestobacter roseus]